MKGSHKNRTIHSTTEMDLYLHFISEHCMLSSALGENKPLHLILVKGLFPFMTSAGRLNRGQLQLNPLNGYLIWTSIKLLSGG